MSGPIPSSEGLSSPILRIVLTGFMGAGKTTVGGLLAQRLRWSFLDSDRQIESRACLSIAEIFAQRGEAAFRQIEAAVIREAVGGTNLVLAVGGGALETAETRDLLLSLRDTVTVFLEAPLEMLLARCASHGNGPVRPVLADRPRLEERWRSRAPWYRQAHLTISTAGLAPEEVAERVLVEIRGLPAGSGAAVDSVRAGAIR